MAIPDGAIGRIIVFGHFAITITGKVSLKGAADIRTHLLIADTFIARTKRLSDTTFLCRIIGTGTIPALAAESGTVKP